MSGQDGLLSRGALARDADSILFVLSRAQLLKVEKGKDMATKKDLPDWLVTALVENGGKGRIVTLCKLVWDAHEQEMRESGDFFYTWQYDIRWAATSLRKSGVLKSAEMSPAGLWELA